MAAEDMAAEDQAAVPTVKNQQVSQSAAAGLRAWPLVLVVVCLWFFKIVPFWLAPESPKAFNPMFLGVLASIGTFLLWWLFASRTPWLDRLIGFFLLVGGLAAGVLAGYHPTVTGLPLLFYVLPRVITAVAAALLLTKLLGWPRGRRVALLTAIVAVLAPGGLRFGPVNSNFSPAVMLRWQADKEELLLASLGDPPAATPRENAPAAGDPDPADAGDAPPAASEDWPGFRGAKRNGHTTAGQLAADWSDGAPTEVWRRAIGPGWGSFCLVDQTLYTQEQRGEQECVAAYAAATGEPIWLASVPARFSESVAGPGPRATPTHHAGALYTTGAAGHVQRLDAATGEVVWRRNLIEDTPQENPPAWGFASSPLVVTLDDQRELVLVYAGNPMGKDTPGNQAVIAYDANTGEPAWRSGLGDHGYSSPHLAALGGVGQVLMWSNKGLESLDPATGARLWFYDWDIGQYPRSTQPLLIDDQTLVLSAGYDSGTMLLRVTNEAGQWQAKELWDAPSRDLVPYFNDLVLHDGHLFGLHKKFLVSVNLQTGKATWPRKVKRKTKLGNGQLVLDPQAGRLLVTTEDTGEVLLVEANPETFVVRGRFEALPPETNWNHPVVAGGRLYVRHGSEAACYQLPEPQPLTPQTSTPQPSPSQPTL